MTWFLNKLHRRVAQQTICRSISTKLYWRVVHTIFVGVCPLNYIGGLINKFGYRRLSNEFLETKIFCFENSFSYMASACVRKSVRTRGMGYGT